jgi:hypothetical protein
MHNMIYKGCFGSVTYDDETETFIAVSRTFSAMASPLGGAPWKNSAWPSASR